MSKPDFDFSKYVDVPDRWIENALNIPNTVRYAPKVIPIRRYVAAASVVLTVALGFSLFFIFRNKQPIPVAPTIPAVSTEQPSAAAPSPAPSPTAQPTDNPPTPTTAPTIAPATQPVTDAEGTITVITITQTSADRTDAATLSTAAPTEAVQPSIIPTTAEPSTQPAAVPTAQPTVPHTEPATKAPDMRRLVLTLQRIPMPDAEEDDGALYCCIYDSSGAPLGGKNLYGNDHRISEQATGWQVEDVVWYYSVEYDANAVPDNRFTYQVYDVHGTVIDSGTMIA